MWREYNDGCFTFYVNTETGEQKFALVPEDIEIKPRVKKTYTAHEVACIIAELFGDSCACNFNDCDEWLAFCCDYRETKCPEPGGVKCWEQYLKYREVKDLVKRE